MTLRLTYMIDWVVLVSHSSSILLLGFRPNRTQFHIQSFTLLITVCKSAS